MRPEVPHRLCTFEVALWQALLSVDKVRELEWVANEEYRRVVANNVPVAFFGIELQREATRITFGVCRTALTTDSGESQEGWRLLTDSLK
ncbi:hypothetical protein D3C76_935860 [compost metagenome]